MKYAIRNRFKIICFGLTLLILPGVSVKAQVLSDTATLNLIKLGVDYIYNYQFDKASAVYEKIKSRYPDHPVPYLFRGMMTYWKYFPLIPSSPALKSYTDDLLTCMDLCVKKSNALWEAEFLLSDLGARGLLLLYYSDNDLSMDVIPLASTTYQPLMQSFDYTNTYADFYYFTGLYRYYREAYPEAHPVYKPIAMLFRRGDRKRGLNELKLAAGYSIFMKAEASAFLTNIYISFEHNYPSACQYSKSLHERYPENSYFLACYIKILLLDKQYEEAEKMLKQLKNSNNTYFRMQKNILEGILIEKKYGNLKYAESLYNAGIKEAVSLGDFANEFQAFGYFGLSRIMKARNDAKSSKSYHKKAVDLAEYKDLNFNE
jgi:hypothetical protein